MVDSEAALLLEAPDEVEEVGVLPPTPPLGNARLGVSVGVGEMEGDAVGEDFPVSGEGVEREEREAWECVERGEGVEEREAEGVEEGVGLPVREEEGGVEGELRGDLEER